MSDLPSTTCPYLRKSSRARKYRDLSNYRELLPEPEYQKSAVNEADVTCQKQRELSRQIIMEKMAKTDSFIGRVVGNIFSHISNDNHAQEVMRVLDTFGIMHGVGLACFFFK
jgi:transcriptional antiterminator